MDAPDDLQRRWHSGEEVPGARYTRGAAVRITDGRRAGERGEVIALERLDPPTYLLRLSSGQNLMVLESALGGAE